MSQATVLLEHHLKQLKLPTMLREYGKMAAVCHGERSDYQTYLLRLCEQELVEREQRAAERRVKAARFPVIKTLDTFDFKAYGKPLKRALTKWSPQCRITPKDLRNTLQDHAEKKAWNKFYSERYVGHAARDIRGKHYVGSEAGKLAEDFRSEIAEKIDRIIEKRFQDRPKDTLIARCSTFCQKNNESGRKSIRPDH